MRTPVALLLLTLASCQSAYYGTMEAFGVHKREILVDRVGDARDEQKEAKDQFQSALKRFQELTGHQGGDLEALYDKLNAEYEGCESQAKDVSSHIDSVEDVADAMFREWKEELEQYSDQGLRDQSETKLRETKARCRDLVAVMRKAERAMRPVLSAFKDRVLFLKHNLNAQAIASLQGHAATLENDIGKLVEQMEAAIREANAFIDSMPKS
jgi:ElaB/YqjD/DUF883 family membrane-anchored ribosome-binding protein